MTAVTAPATQFPFLTQWVERRNQFLENVGEIEGAPPKRYGSVGEAAPDVLKFGAQVSDAVVDGTAVAAGRTPALTTTFEPGAGLKTSASKWSEQLDALTSWRYAGNGTVPQAATELLDQVAQRRVEILRIARGPEYLGALDALSTRSLVGAKAAIARLDGLIAVQGQQGADDAVRAAKATLDSLVKSGAFDEALKAIKRV